MSLTPHVFRFPLITVKSVHREGNKVTLDVHQQWFLADGSSTDSEDKTWLVPLLISTKSSKGATTLHLMEGKTDKVVVTAAEGDWIKLNAGQTSLLRVAYTPEMLAALANGIRNKELAPEDRGAVLGDAYALSKAGKLDLRSVVRRGI